MVELLTSEANPLLEGLQLRRRPEPCIVVIFGASGDLASRKLIPALYALQLRHLLPADFADPEMGPLLEERLRAIGAEHGTEGNCVHYFSVPPSAIPVLVEQIGTR